MSAGRVLAAALSLCACVARPAVAQTTSGPVWTSSGDPCDSAQFIEIGKTQTLQLTASSPGNARDIRVVVTDKPAFVQTVVPPDNQDTPVVHVGITASPTTSTAEVGKVYLLSLRATDTSGASATCSYRYNVTSNAPPPIEWNPPHCSKQIDVNPFSGWERSIDAIAPDATRAQMHSVQALQIPSFVSVDVNEEVLAPTLGGTVITTFIRAGVGDPADAFDSIIGKTGVLRLRALDTQNQVSDCDITFRLGLLPATFALPSFDTLLHDLCHLILGPDGDCSAFRSPDWQPSPVMQATARNAFSG